MKISGSFFVTLILLGLISVSAIAAKPVMGEGHGIYGDIISKLKSEIAQMEDILVSHGLSIDDYEDKDSSKRTLESQAATNSTKGLAGIHQTATSETVGGVNINQSTEGLLSDVECTRISRTFRFGDYDQEIMKIQRFLEAKGHFDHPHITPYFGPVTERAVRDFQVARGIVSSGAPETTGFGQVGPKTRSTIEDISCQIHSIGSDM